MDAYWKNEFGFIRHLQRLVKEWISQIDLSAFAAKKKELIDNEGDYFFTFNYTNTLEDVYHIENVMHIHGSIGENADYEPMMGHCNKSEIDKYRELSREADEIYDEGGVSINEAISDYLSEIFKDTSFLIWQQDHYFSRLSSVNHIIILGWSAGEVDIPYLQKIRHALIVGQNGLHISLMTLHLIVLKMRLTRQVLQPILTRNFYQPPSFGTNEFAFLHSRLFFTTRIKNYFYFWR